MVNLLEVNSTTCRPKLWDLPSAPGSDSWKLQKDNFLHPCLSAISSKISIATKELPRKNAREDLFRVMISVRGFSLSLLTNPYFAPKFQRNRRFSDGKVLCPCRSCGLTAWTFRWVQDFQNGENNRQNWSYTPNYQLKTIEMKCLFWSYKRSHHKMPKLQIPLDLSSSSTQHAQR